RVAVAGTQALLRARDRTPVTVHQLDLEVGERLAHPLRAAEVRRVRVDAERPGQGQDPERARDVHRDDRAVDDALVIEVHGAGWADAGAGSAAGGTRAATAQRRSSMTRVLIVGAP